MKKPIIMILVLALVLALCGCGAHKADCKVISAEFVDAVPMNGGIQVNYEGKRENENQGDQLFHGGVPPCDM